MCFNSGPGAYDIKGFLDKKCKGERMANTIGKSDTKQMAPKVSQCNVLLTVRSYLGIGPRPLDLATLEKRIAQL